jgi:hypothetical protein
MYHGAYPGPLFAATASTWSMIDGVSSLVTSEALLLEDGGEHAGKLLDTLF